MRQTSELWTRLASAGRFRMESMADIGGKAYTSISAPVINRALFTDSLSVGNCIAASLKFSVLTDDEIARAAETVIRARITDDVEISEWEEFGTFYIDSRTTNDGLVTLQCYDAMLKGNQNYVDETKPDDRIGWPKSMQACVNEIAYRIGVPLDSRTSIKTGDPYVVPYPAKLTMMQVLGYIGAVHGGNWIITPDNKLRLVPLVSPPDETFDVIDHSYNKLHTADSYKLVWKHAPSATPQEHGAGGGLINVPVVTGKITTGRNMQISRVTITRDEKLGYTAGDSTGFELKIANNPYACQAICDDLLRQLKGILYSPYTITGSCYDPAAELGDWILVSDQIRSVLCSETVKMNIDFRADASAPGKDELESEYPYLTEIKKLQTEDEKLKEYMDEAKDEISSRIEQTYTEIILEAAGTYASKDAVSASIDIVAESITTEVTRATAAEEELSGRLQVTAENITAEVKRVTTAETERATAAEEELSGRLEVTAESITAEVTRAIAEEERLSASLEMTTENIRTEISDEKKSLQSSFEQKVNSIALSVSNSTTSSTITLSIDGIKAQSKTIEFTGDIILASDLTDGKTIISGNNIQTGQIDADLITTGKIQSKNSKVYFDLDNNELACSKMINRSNESITINGVSYANTVAELQTVTAGSTRSYGLLLYKENNESYGMLFTPGVSSSSEAAIRSGSRLIVQASLSRIGYPKLDLSNDSDMITLTTKSNTTLLLESDSALLQSGGGGYIQIGSDKVTYISGGLDVRNGDFKVYGTKSRVLQTPDYGERLLYCYETTSPLFGDVGCGETDESGCCYILFDDIFAETVNSGMEYHVFLQAEGSGSLWIAEKTPDFFIVHGTPGLKFSWEVKAKQVDYDSLRLEDSYGPDSGNDIDYEAQAAQMLSNYIQEMEDMNYAEIDKFY